ncbi:MAG TPA: DUF4249 domain-containing protein [Cyclobacteriaceae bacterium]
MTTRIHTSAIFLLLFAGACVEQYNPPRESSEFLGYLVVDGYLDGNTGNATVKLARSVTLNSYSALPYETDANVIVEIENGGSFSLKEGSNGLYTANNVNFDSKSNYRLNVKTKHGSSYTSDYISLKKSPSFDSLVWRAEDTGIRFYVNGHDDTGGTKYYQYLFDETWAYGVPFVSHYKNIDGLPVKRRNNELVADCWDSRGSANVLIKSTNDLSKDVVSMFPIYFIKKGERKLLVLYSINVEQRALSEREYSFWTQIKRNNESLGGLFDPIPSQVTGNVRCDDNSEPVLGYFTGGYSKQTRIFLKLDDLPKSLQSLDPLGYDCATWDFSLSRGEAIGAQIYLDIHIPPNVYFVTSPNCGDCISLGGDTIRPKYWPQTE